MSGMPPGMAMPGGESRSCRCGFVHPPPWDENCPMVQGENQNQDEKSIAITGFCSKLATFLHTRKDYERIIEMFAERLKF